MEQISKKIESLAENWHKFQSIHESEAESLKAKVRSLEQKYNNFIVDSYRPNSGLKAPKGHVGEFIRKGNVHPSLVCKASSLLAGASDPSSAIVESSMSKKVFGLLKALSPLRKLASVEEVSASALEVLVQEEDFECNWVAEGADRDITQAAKLSKRRILLHQLYAQPKASQVLLDDASVDVERWLVDQLGQSFARKEDESFIRGDGVSMPEGLLGALGLGGKVESGDRRELCQVILQLVNKLEDRYQANASFFMSRSALLEVQRLKDQQGRFLWQPMLSEAIPETLLGRPVFCSDYMPAFTENGTPLILFGDFKSAYKIIDHSEMTIMRDPFSHKPFVSFYAVKRVGGSTLDKNALVWLQFTA